MLPMFEEDDDFELIELGLICLGNNRFDLFELYEKNDQEGNDFLVGKYEIKNQGYILGQSTLKEQLSQNLSSILKMRKRGMHRFVAAKVRLRKIWLYLN